jgi:calreticulin
MKITATATLMAAASATTYFSEDFNSGLDKWTQSETKDAGERGEFTTEAGAFYGDEKNLKLKTSQDARHYHLTAKLDTPIENKGKTLVVQYSVKNEQDIDCGGAYIKLTGDIDQKKFSGDSDYAIMFGPDICGTSNKKTHAILSYPGADGKLENFLHNDNVKVESDKHTHLYTFVLNADDTYDVLIDNESVQKGKISENWKMLGDKEIKDPALSKPTDWVDEKQIDDPEDVKPAGYDDIAKQLPDPAATKPDDWDDEDDGEWEPPMIDNPEFKGEWKAKRIENPAYKGEWEHPMVANPDYKEDDALHARCNPCTHVGFDLWQVKSGTLFDDILVTDSIEEAKTAAAAWEAELKGEKAMSEKQDAEAKEKADAAAAAAKAEEDAKAPAADASDDDDEEKDEKKEEL